MQKIQNLSSSGYTTVSTSSSEELRPQRSRLRRLSCFILLCLTVVDLYLYGVWRNQRRLKKLNQPDDLQSNPKADIQLTESLFEDLETITSNGRIYYVFRPTPWKKSFEPPCELLRLTHMYSKRCDLKSDETWRLLITATGRSGTLGTVLCLNASGLSFEHDRTVPLPHDKDGCVSWPTLFKGMHWGPMLNHRKFMHMFLQTRNPLTSISSRAAAIRPVHDAKCCVALRYKYLKDEVMHNSKEAFLISMRYWVTWNAFGSIIAEKHFQIEERTGRMMEALWKEIMPHEKRQTDFSQCDLISDSAHTEHSHEHTPTTWDYLHDLDSNYATMAKILARKFGYDVEIDPESSFSCFLGKSLKWNCRLIDWSNEHIRAGISENTWHRAGISENQLIPIAVVKG